MIATVMPNFTVQRELDWKSWGVSPQSCVVHVIVWSEREIDHESDQLLTTRRKAAVLWSVFAVVFAVEITFCQ